MLYINNIILITFQLCFNFYSDYYTYLLLHYCNLFVITPLLLSLILIDIIDEIITYTGNIKNANIF